MSLIIKIWFFALSIYSAGVRSVIMFGIVGMCPVVKLDQNAVELSSRAPKLSDMVPGPPLLLIFATMLFYGLDWQGSQSQLSMFVVSYILQSFLVKL